MVRLSTMNCAFALGFQLAGAQRTPNAPLQFKDDGTFHISIFSDLHFGERYNTPRGVGQDAKTVRIMGDLLDYEKPDFVVLNGDLITGDGVPLHNGTKWLDQILSPMVERNLTWGSTYGNHDHQKNLNSDHMLKKEHTYQGSRTKRMVCSETAGTSNYYLPVYRAGCSPTDEDCNPELILWFFDSRGGFQFQKTNSDGSRVGQANWVDISVVAWFLKENALLTAKYGKRIPPLAFVHIPTYASLALQKEHGRDSIDPKKQPGINDDYELAPQAQGWCADGRNDGSCTYGGQDVPFMQAITSTPGLIGVFSGHDHGATWCYKWDRLVSGMAVKGNGVNLCFGQHSGYGGYGNWIRGARQIKVSKDMLKRAEAHSWVRLESGSIVGDVMLNATYGKDEYPETPNDKTYCPTCDYTVVTPHPKMKADASPKEISHGEWLRNQFWKIGGTQQSM
ncbi:hypothetical protein Golomagni_06323 [Golovinomyces magnicellulatus]|nr:hypothetical protein Golomagni_06323 [Golovinomyces magnicellulatus]